MQSINKGAPLDVAFINELVNEVERLAADVGSSQNRRASVTDGVFSRSPATTVRTADARIQAEAFFVKNLIDASPGQYGSFDLPLTKFSGTPVVTITPILINPGTTKADISATIISVTQSEVHGYVTSNVKLADTQQIALSLIAIGVPSEQ